MQEVFQSHDDLDLFDRFFVGTTWMVPTSGMTSLVGILDVAKEAT
jgi:hypothetical protein